MKLKHLLAFICFIMSVLNLSAQTLTHQHTDPCTGKVTFFSVPATGTIIFFLGQSRQFTSADIQSGVFQAWVNQVYADYRKVSPCGQQSGQVTQNQITSQIIGNTVQSVVGSIMSQAQSAASGTIASVASSASASASSSAGGSDAASKNNKDGDGPKKNSSSNSTSGNSGGTTGGGNTSGGNSGGGTGGGNTSGGNSGGSTGGGSTGGGSSGGSTGGGTTGGGTKETTKTEEAKTEEVAATTTMNIDAQNQNSSNNESGGENSGGDKNGGGKGGGKGNSKAGNSNPMIISSDFTTAQNLDKSFTPILNLSMSQSSMTGASSWGLTSMIWFNFKQFALSGKYTKMNFSKNGKLKWIHNMSLTGVYSYGNIIGFVGYSGILNAGKWGVTGFNTSIAMTKINDEDKNTFISPSITAFYTKPFMASKKLTISPELYIISTPLLYSSKEKITTSDRTFSAFIGSGFDYKISKRFKFNINYKANMSTNPDFPILSFFLIGSKVNL